MFKEEKMAFVIGIYEVIFENNNVIQIPKAWRKRISKTDTLYCKFSEYESKDDEMLTKLICCFERSYFNNVDDVDVFTIAIDRRHRMHIPKKCLEACNFKDNDFVLLMGWGDIITIKAKRDKLKVTDTDELEQLIHQTVNLEEH